MQGVQVPLLPKLAKIMCNCIYMYIYINTLSYKPVYVFCNALLAIKIPRKGTCMILDEMAMPLMRSWCLFELLQTIELEEKAQAANVRPLVLSLERASKAVVFVRGITEENKL